MCNTNQTLTRMERLKLNKKWGKRRKTSMRTFFVPFLFSATCFNLIVARFFWSFGRNQSNDKELSINVIEETPINIIEETPINIIEETPINIIEETPININDETPTKDNRLTGSFVDCNTNFNKNIYTNSKPNSERRRNRSHYTESVLTASCRNITYRIHPDAFQKGDSIIIGVLSSASGKGPARRNSIRQTWAQDRTGIFFLVSGSWDRELSHEYRRHRDLIWIDAPESYNLVTLKTYSFISIVNIMTSKMRFSYSHVFKTDDDSYVDVDALRDELMNKNSKDAPTTRHYLGQCQMKYTDVIRDVGYKWSLEKNIYPEPLLPRYCQGAGYALSKEFVKCAGNHIAKMRFLSHEDVAVGMLAERCHFNPTTVTNTTEIKIDRYESKEARERVRKGDTTIDNLIPIAACMTGRIVQHRVIDADDMKELHRTVLDPNYCRETRSRRNKMIAKMENDGLEWFG